MIFLCRIRYRTDGRWSVFHAGHDPDVGHIEVTACDRQEAIRKMRGEIRCRLCLDNRAGQLHQTVELKFEPDDEVA